MQQIKMLSLMQKPFRVRVRKLFHFVGKINLVRWKILGTDCPELGTGFAPSTIADFGLGNARTTYDYVLNLINATATYTGEYPLPTATNGLSYIFNKLISSYEITNTCNYPVKVYLMWMECSRTPGDSASQLNPLQEMCDDHKVVLEPGPGPSFTIYQNTSQTVDMLPDHKPWRASKNSDFDSQWKPRKHKIFTLQPGACLKVVKRGRYSDQDDWFRWNSYDWNANLTSPPWRSGISSSLLMGVSGAEMMKSTTTAGVPTTTGNSLSGLPPGAVSIAAVHRVNVWKPIQIVGSSASSRPYAPMYINVNNDDYVETDATKLKFFTDETEQTDMDG